MKIGIDISQIVYQGTGVARYTQKLVENLLKFDKTNEYVFFFSSLRRNIKYQISNIKYADEKLKIIKFKLPPSLLDLLWNRLHILPIENFVGGVDVFHSSDWTQPPAKRAKLVTTVHDLTPWKYPSTLDAKIISTHNRRMNWVKKECSLIIADSISTKKDLVEIIGIPEEKIRVIYLGVDPGVTPGQGEQDNYVLTVGTREPRKNLGRLVKAFNLINEQFPGLKLVIAGRYGWGDSKIKNEKLKVKNIEILGYVSEKKLTKLYQRAKVFVYPSLYEGFGLPILEAMSYGCPVITSNVSSMPELAGRAAILVDPKSTTAIADAIQKILKDAGLRKILIQRGREQVMKFTWQKTALNTLKVYEEALKC